MKNLYFLLLLVLMTACNNPGGKTAVEKISQEEKTAQKPEDMKTKTFSELFKSVSPSEMEGNVFKLVGQDFTVVTAGNQEDYNSMTASYGGWGQLFDEPVTWCFLRANRYTLEYMRKAKKYTMAYFDAPYKEQVLYFGSVSGRSGDKMKKHTLTAVETPGGSIAYKEAKLIIECELMEVTTVNPDDFLTEKGKQFVVEAYDEAKDYHKLVFGKITHVWTKKN